MRSPEIDRLYAAVTTAILVAEGLDGKDQAASVAAYDGLSTIESKIAELIGPEDLEGDIARRGAVYAALRAGHPTRAIVLADRYLSEPNIPDRLREHLADLREQAVAVVDVVDDANGAAVTK